MRWLGVLAFGLIILVLVLFGNALRHAPMPRSHQQPPLETGIDAHTVAEHLAQAIRFRTVSHQDPRQDDPQPLAALRAFLEATYPRVHASFERELIHEHALLYRWPGSDPNAQPVLFMAHQDVVPIEPGSESRWTHPPFDGAIVDDFVWGRGALDDKGSLIALLEAFESLLAEGFRPRRSVYLASGFDEEVGGSQGSQYIVAELQRRNVRFSWVIDEGGAVGPRGTVPFVDRPVALVCVAEKGYLSLELIARAEGGHSSMPPMPTSVGMLSAAITRLERDPFPPRLTPTIREMLETLAPEMPWLQRVGLSNLWLTQPLVVRKMSSDFQTSPSVRTTTAPTILQAGVKENVVPSEARATVNFRILPGESIAQVIDRVRDVIAEPHIEIKRLTRTLSEPAPPSSTSGPGYQLLRATISKLYPDAVVTPGIMNGASDARHFQPIADNVYRFIPRSLDKRDLKRIHGIDERVSVDDLARSVQGYRMLIREGSR
jgi:carboxypeptidase PM20D1